jgi:uncharacterized membrane protein YoaK (UPF0700 family)
VSLAGFVVGAGGGGLLVRRVRARHRAMVAGALGVEATLLTAVGVLAAAVSVRAGHTAAYIVIAAIALAMGVRNAIVRRIGIPDLTTTVLTMTLTGLAAESRLAGGSGKGSVRRSAAVVAMLAGAIVGALLEKAALYLPIAVAAALALVTAGLYLPGAARRP